MFGEMLTLSTKKNIESFFNIFSFLRAKANIACLRPFFPPSYCSHFPFQLVNVHLVSVKSNA